MPTGRHNNQDRAVAPEQDARLREIAAVLSRSGLPAELCDILAEGYIFRLRRRAWSQLSDQMGTGDDVESLLGWKGPPRVLSKALERAGYLKDAKGVLLATDAVPEAPEYIKARWRRHSKADYDAAAARASEQPNTVNPVKPPRPPLPEWEDDMPQETLFGSMPDEPEKHCHATPGHRELVTYWAERYLAAERRHYVWRKSDFRFIQLILNESDSLAAAKRAADGFLAERTPFYAGHLLRQLYADINKFIGWRKPQAGSSSPSQARTGAVTVRLGGVPAPAEGAGPGPA